MKLVRNFHPSHKPLVIVLLGPTAAGKTSLAIQIAEKMKLHIHSIDSRQVYIGMDIGTAKPTKEQQERVNHYLIDLGKPDQPISLHEFQKQAIKSLKQSFKSKGAGFLVGGSGLYLKALTKGLIPPSVPAQKDLRKQLKDLGQTICYQMLKAADPSAAKKIARADEIRTHRALEVLYSTGQPISTQQRAKPPNWQLIELGLDPKNLRERISSRTKELYKNGLIEETEQLIKQFGSDLPMLQTIGYKEVLDLLHGKLNLNEAISITNRRTHQFAKRQRTWFRKQHDAHWLNDEEPLREALALIQAGLG